jgi:hypothetical protein
MSFILKYHRENDPFFVQIQEFSFFNPVLHITLNIDGSPIVSKSHTHPSHSQTSCLLTSSLSFGVPVHHEVYHEDQSRYTSVDPSTLDFQVVFHTDTHTYVFYLSLVFLHHKLKVFSLGLCLGV